MKILAWHFGIFGILYLAWRFYWTSAFWEARRTDKLLETLDMNWCRNAVIKDDDDDDDEDDNDNIDKW